MSISDKFRGSEKGRAYKPPRPWHLLQTDRLRATDEVAVARLNMCKACPELINVTNQCKKCGCFMNLKVKLAEAYCPLYKWAPTHDGSYDD